MSKAAELLDLLRLEDFTVSARDGKLLVSPKSKLTPALAGSIREHKPALLELLEAERPLTPLERFLATHRPTAGCEVIVERGKGKYVAVGLCEYQEAIGEQP